MKMMLNHRQKSIKFLEVPHDYFTHSIKLLNSNISFSILTQMKHTANQDSTASTDQSRTLDQQQASNVYRKWIKTWNIAVMKNNVLTVKKKAMSNQTKQINDNLHFKQQEWFFSATHSYLLSSTLP